MITFFLNTGIQRAVVEMDDGALAQRRVEPISLGRSLGSRWLFTNVPFVRVFSQRRGTTTSFVLAVDTREGLPTDGFAGTREQILSRERASFGVAISLPAAFAVGQIELCEITLALEAPINVALVLDMGNTRTCGLLVEDDDPASPIGPETFRPVPLQSVRDPIGSRPLVFDSTLEFVPPHWEPGLGQYVLEYRPHTGLLARLKRRCLRRPIIDGQLFYRRSRSFANDSVAALGQDAVAWRHRTHHISPPTTGLSSPKRYLWADTPVESAWKYAALIGDVRVELCPIKGDVLFYVTPTDSAEFLTQDGSEPVATDAPGEPRYPKRAVSVFFLFEILKRTYAFINSYDHRVESRQPLRPRVLTDLVLTYPSALGPAEVDSLAVQARKALKIFQTLYNAPGAPTRIRLHTRWDEGIASQLCYVASEVRQNGAALKARFGATRTFKVASLDFGGGTLDAAVATYSKGALQGEFECRVDLVDGDFVGGDDLVRLIIRELFLPQLIDFVGDAKASSAMLNTFRDSGNSGAPFRIRALREIFVPLAHGILSATTKTPVPSTISVADLCPDDSLDWLGEHLFGRESRGRLRTWEVHFDADAVKERLTKCFGTTVSHLLARMPLSDLDVMVLAGRLASLPGVLSLVKERLTAASSHVSVVPFDRIKGVKQIHRAIYGDSAVDPKVSVVLGAALAFTGAWGRAPSGLRFTVDYAAVAGPFYWGLVDADSLRFSDLLGGSFLSPDGDDGKVAELALARGCYYVGRRTASAGEAGTAMLRYRLLVERDGPVRIGRVRDAATNEEVLRVEPSGTPPVAQLLPQSHVARPYWLDTGALWDVGEE